MSKRISNLRSQIDDVAHPQQRANLSDRAAQQGPSLPEINTDICDPSAIKQFVRIADSNSEIR
jgi:hypothetical protein